MNSLAEILGTRVEEGESWQAVFDRLSATGAVDMKTLTKIIIYLLERFDEYERHRKEDREYGYDSDGCPVMSGHPLSKAERTGFRGEDGGISEGAGGTDEKVQPNPESTGDNSDSGSTQESEPVIA